MVSEMCVKVWAACFQALQHSGSILCVAFCRHSCWHDTWPPGRLLPPPAASCRLLPPPAAPCFLLCPTCCLLHCTEPWQQTNNWKIFTLIENISSPIEENAFEEEFSLLHHNDKAGVRCWLETTTSSVDTVYCAQVRPSSCSTANVDSGQCSCYLHSFISAHTTALLIARHIIAFWFWYNSTIHSYGSVLLRRLHISSARRVPVFVCYHLPSVIDGLTSFLATILTAWQMKYQFNVFYLDVSPWSINWLHYQFSFIIQILKQVWWRDMWQLSTSPRQSCLSSPQLHFFFSYSSLLPLLSSYSLDVSKILTSGQLAASDS